MGPTPAETPLETLFDRYRETGRPELLAAVFDRTAPALLRLAVHLVRDTGDAEDLVQATFLAAIERAASYDARRPLEAWLTGILENRALATHRRRRRAPETARVRERPAPRTPAELAELGELSGRLEQALDALPEPYRRPCVLRFLHGLEPSAIAHVLDRPPGTVRVQLHRGLERLKQGLPAGFVASLALLVTPARGLAAVRDAVVARAGTVPVAAAAATTGGVLVTKKLLGAAGLAALLVGGWLGWSALDDDAPRPARVASAVAPPLAAPGELAAPTPARVDSAETASPVPAEPGRAPQSVPAAAPDEPARTLRGRVLRGDTGAPVPDVAVELHAPRALTLGEIERRWGDVLEHQLDGRPVSDVAWLSIPGELGLRERLLDAPIEVLAPPPADGAPLARTRTGADGTFALELPAAGGALVLRRAGLAERVVAVRELPDEEEGGVLVVTLWPEARLAGRVVRPDGRPLERPITLRLRDASQLPALGDWSVRTDAEGRFATSLASPTVRAWALVDVATDDPERLLRELWLFPEELAPGERAEELVLQPWRKVPPALFVTDAATGAPIERLRLRSFGEHGMVRYCGRFPAPDGWLHVYGGAAPWGRLLSYDYLLQRDGRVELDVWSDGYRPERVVLDLAGDAAQRIAHVALEPGAGAGIAGGVLDGGAPVAGASVVLAVYRDFAWRADDAGTALAAVTTAEDGAFAFTAPAGDYLLRVTVDAATWVRAVTLPAAEPVFVELDRFARVTVVVTDGAGRPVAEHPVMVRAADRRQAVEPTDARGEAVLDRLPPGTATLAWPWRKPGPSWSADEVRELDLLPGERRVERIELPGGAAPVHARLALPDEPPAPSFEGWRVRLAWATDGRPWHTVEPDGLVPLDLSAGARALEIDAPDGRRWYRSVPPDPPRDLVLALRTAGPAYAGTLVDRESGAPLRGHRVFARETRDDDAVVAASVLTDEQGRFRLEGLAPAPHRLTFHHERDSTLGLDSRSRLRYVSLTPSAPPAEPPTRLDLALPRLDHDLERLRGLPTVAVDGLVRDPAGDPVPGATVSVSALLDLPEGELRVTLEKGMGRTESDGRYRLRAAAGDRYTMWLRAGEAVARDAWDAAIAGGDETRDVRVE